MLANLGLRRQWAALLTFVLASAGVTGLLAVFGLIEVLAAFLPAPGAPAPEAAGFGAGLVVTAAAAAAMLLPDVRSRLARLLPIDPASPVHALALVLGVALLGFNLSYQLSMDVLQQTATAESPLTPLDLVAQETPFLLAGLLGVGWIVRRSGGGSLQRLGLVVPRWWQLALGLAAAGAFYALSTGVDYAGQLLTPDLARKVEVANDHLFGGLNNPPGILTLALAAGICEEVLFRGALQPRFGIVFTSLLFTSVHTQYGISLDTLGVFVISSGLGLLRRFFNTTTSLTCHVCYDLLVGVGVGLTLLPWALAVEAALLGLLAFAFVRGRRPALAVRP